MDRSKNRLKIGYFADGAWAQNVFKLFLADNDIEIRFVCLRYDNPDQVLKEFAEKHCIDLVITKNINGKDFLQKVAGYGCDLFVSMSFDQIFKKDIIFLPPLSSINCHAGKLPFYRGRNILNWVLINNDNEFGITVHYIDEGIDTGDIILQRSFHITDEDTYATLLARAEKECSHILYEAINQIQSGTAKRIPQHLIHPVGFYCTQRGLGDERINWNQTSREVFDFIRAICKPGPMARAFVGDSEIKINKSQLIRHAPNYKGIPGSVVGIELDGFIVKTKDSTIKIVEWEFERKLRIGDRMG